MATINLSLPVPIDFDFDKHLLEKTTPEENATILTAGLNVLKASRHEINSLNSEGARKSLEKSFAEKINSYAVEANAKIENLKKELECARAAASVSASARSAAEEQIAEAMKRARDMGEATCQVSLNDARRLMESALQKAEKAENQNSEMRQHYQEECTKLRAEIAMLNTCINKEKCEAERSKAEAIMSALKVAHDEAATERERMTNHHQQLLMEITTRRACSATKGQDNQQNFGALLFEAFSGNRDYKMYEHKNESGDHIIGFGGKKFMFENKDYDTKVPKAEVDKAHRDLEKHSDCDALVLVSEVSEILGHQRPGNLDIGFHDGRPVLYVGKFCEVPDKINCLRMIHMIIIELLNQIKKAEASNGLVQMEGYKEKISTFRRYFTETNQDMNDLLKSAKDYIRRHKVEWDIFYSNIKTLVFKFGERISKAMTDKEDTTDSYMSSHTSLTPEARYEESHIPVPDGVVSNNIHLMNCEQLKLLLKEKGITLPKKFLLKKQLIAMLSK